MLRTIPRAAQTTAIKSVGVHLLACLTTSVHGAQNTTQNSSDKGNQARRCRPACMPCNLYTCCSVQEPSLVKQHQASSVKYSNLRGYGQMFLAKLLQGPGSPCSCGCSGLIGTECNQVSQGDIQQESENPAQSHACVPTLVCKELRRFCITLRCLSFLQCSTHSRSGRPPRRRQRMLALCCMIASSLRLQVNRKINFCS